jgi:hypothetical protein
MDLSERKARYHLLGLMGASVLGALLVVVLMMGPMGAAQADQQQRAGAKKEGQNKTVQVTAAGKNNYRAKGDENPIVYKSVDSRSGFDGGFYRHVLRCEPGYKAISGGWDFNNPVDLRRHWQILASRFANGGDTWIVDAYGRTDLEGRKPPTFTAYAACAPQELLSGLRYAHDSTTIGKHETKTIKATCATDERAIGGGFEFGSRALDLVRSERSRGDERSWETGARRGSASDSNSLNNWAVCLSRGALEDTQYLEATDTSTERAVAHTPRCPQGTYLLSGGAGMPNSAYDGHLSARWSNSSPPNEGAQSWKASAIQLASLGEKHPPPLTVHAFALCGSFADGDGGGGGDSPDGPGEPEN